MPNFIEKAFDKVWNQFDPPVGTILKPEYRDSNKAGTRHGPNGSGLTRRERARNLDDDGLQKKLTSSQRKMAQEFGGAGKSGTKALASVKLFHWHLTPGAIIDTVAQSASTVKQIPKYNHYEKELLARGKQYTRKPEEGSALNDLWDGVTGNSRTAKKLFGKSETANGLYKLYKANKTPTALTIYKFLGVYNFGLGLELDTLYYTYTDG